MTRLLGGDGLGLDCVGECRDRVDDAVGLDLLLGDETREPEAQEAGRRVTRANNAAPTTTSATPKMPPEMTYGISGYTYFVPDAPHQPNPMTAKPASANARPA